MAPTQLAPKSFIYEDMDFTCYFMYAYVYLKTYSQHVETGPSFLRRARPSLSQLMRRACPPKSQLREAGI